MTAIPVVNSTDLPRLVELLTRQRDLLQAALDISVKQSGHIAAGAIESMQINLTHRQHLIDQILRLGRELDPFRQRWTEWVPLLRGAMREQVNGLIGEIQSLRARIAQIDRQDAAQLQQARDAAGQELGHVTRAGQTLAAYRTAGAVPSSANASGARLTDQKG